MHLTLLSFDSGAVPFFFRPAPFPVFAQSHTRLYLGPRSRAVLDALFWYPSLGPVFITLCICARLGAVLTTLYSARRGRAISATLCLRSSLRAVFATLCPGFRHWAVLAARCLRFCSLAVRALLWCVLIPVQSSPHSVPVASSSRFCHSNRAGPFLS